MKLYHYALFFVLVCVGFFMTAAISLRIKMQEESNRKTEYDCLVAAVDAMVEVVFDGGDHSVTGADLNRAEEVFFQVLEVLWCGSVDGILTENLKMRIPCLVVFSGEGYFRYCYEKENGYMWSEMVPYEQEKIPKRFYEETEELLAEYCAMRNFSVRKYRVEQAEQGIWEQEILPPCVFAIYAPADSGLSDGRNGFVYAASMYRKTAFYVTEDNRYHLQSCSECKENKVIACYSTQKASAEEGANPCETCMKGIKVEH